MQRESQEAALVIVPVVLMPCDVVAGHEGGAPQQGALAPPPQHVAAPPAVARPLRAAPGPCPRLTRARACACATDTGKGGGGESACRSV